MKYAVEMGSGTTIYIPSFTKIGSDIQKLIRGIHKHTDRKEITLSLL
jgi:prolyl-tRNA synthetase